MRFEILPVAFYGIFFPLIVSVFQMSSFAQIVFEDGKGELRDEQGGELMEVDDMEIQVKILVMIDQYLHRQLNVEPELANKPP